VISRQDLGEVSHELGLLDPAGLEALFAEAEAGSRGRTLTAIVPLSPGGPRLLFRKLRHGGLFGPLLGAAFFGMRRPLHELEVTALLRDAGAPVPRPALAVGRRRFGPVTESAVATFYEEGTIDALAFLEAEVSPDEILRLAAAMGQAVRAFHDAGGRHADLHVKNLLVRKHGDRFEVIVIDLDKARVTPGLTPGERMAQIMRLFRSLVKHGLLERVGARGCARFFGSYCGSDRLLRRALWVRVDRELRLVAIHALRYRGERA